jgi:hypothetical protein
VPGSSSRAEIENAISTDSPIRGRAGVTAAARLETLRARSASAGSPERRPRSRGAVEGGDGAGDDGGVYLEPHHVGVDIVGNRRRAG